MKSQKEIEKQEKNQLIDDKREQIAREKIKEQEKKNRIFEAKQTEMDKNEKLKELTQITVINKSDVVKKIKNRKQTDKEKNMILDNIEDKFVKKELMRQRQEEIQKRKYSYFSRKNIVKEEEKQIEKKKRLAEEFERKEKERKRKREIEKQKLAQQEKI